MIFIIHKTQGLTFDLIKIFGTEEKNSALLVGDGAFYSNELMCKRMHAAGVSMLYVEKDALQTKKIRLGESVKVVDYDEIVALLLEKNEKIISI